MELERQEISLIDSKRWPARRRLWWARHPRLIDALVASLYFVFTLFFIGQFEIIESLDQPARLLFALLVLIGNTLAILFRRKWTVTASIVVLILGVLAVLQGWSADVFAIAIMIFALAVHRTMALASLFFALFLAGALVAPYVPGSAAGVPDGFDVTILVLGAVIGLLAGVAGRSRRDYIRSLVSRASQMEQLAAAKERTRIAREMHDIVSHTLTVVITLADGAVASKNETKAKTAMKGAADAARGAMSDLRGLLGALREDGEAPFKPQPNAKELPELVDQFIRTGLPAHLSVSGTPDADPAVGLAIHRITQEGLTNALRYSRSPTAVDVTIDYGPDGVDVVVENDGAILHAPSAGAGQGLLSLRERLAFLGGEIESQSAGDGIWRLQAWIPRGHTHEGKAS